PEVALKQTERYWKKWAKPCLRKGKWPDAIVRSLSTLKGLTYAPTGGIVAAATTSLPEKIGGVRNWDYRYCWLRDATFTLFAFLRVGYHDEARSWRHWLLRAIAGSASQMQILYGVSGERRLPELELSWLPGYEKSAPVRTGNAASNQFQLDVYGEIASSMYHAQSAGIAAERPAWDLLVPLMGFLPLEDKRVRGTVAAIQRELVVAGFVLRYRPEEEDVDGLPGDEGVFLPCSFWLASCLHLLGQKKKARELFERLLKLRND